MTWAGLWGESRTCQCSSCFVHILSPKLPNHPTTACPRYPEMLELPWELVGWRTSLLSAINVPKYSPLGFENYTWGKGKAGGGGGQRVVLGVTITQWHRGTAAPLVQKRHRYLCSTCTNQMLIRLANKYFFNIILPLFSPASPGFGCRCRGGGDSESVPGSCRG